LKGIFVDFHNSKPPDRPLDNLTRPLRNPLFDADKLDEKSPLGLGDNLAFDTDGLLRKQAKNIQIPFHNKKEKLIL